MGKARSARRGRAFEPTRAMENLEQDKPKSDDIAAGMIVAGKYQLVAPLGEGGMASVWLAENTLLDIPVAMKFIRAEVDGPDGLAAARLLLEARAAARLTHPSTVRVLDYGKAEAGHAFIVMERLIGQDMGVQLEFGERMPADRAVMTVLPIVRALEEAHAEGLVHRDVKPENIFLAQESNGLVRPKLIDFGIARHAAHDETRLTRTGAILGSPAYLSPEQAAGHDVTEAADVWGVCVVLYELITGSTPFEGTNLPSLLRTICERPPTPMGEHVEGEDELWALIERGIRKRPDDRWPAMRSLGDALARWLQARGIHHDITGQSVLVAGSLPPPASEEAVLPTLAGDDHTPAPLVVALDDDTPEIEVGPASVAEHALPTDAPEAEAPTPVAPVPTAPSRWRRYRGLAAAAVALGLAGLAVSPSFDAPVTPAASLGGAVHAVAPPTEAPAAAPVETAASPAAPTSDDGPPMSHEDEPAAATFAIDVTSDPPGMWVFLDGTYTGQITPAQVHARPGDRIEIRSDGYLPAVQTVSSVNPAMHFSMAAKKHDPKPRPKPRSKHSIFSRR